MPGRNYSSADYRYGFNGKESDNEVSGNGNSYDYGFRIYNPRIAKFLSVDPLSSSYPWYTPYQFAGNKPIWAIDLDGLEEFIPDPSSSEALIEQVKAEEIRRKSLPLEEKKSRDKQTDLFLSGITPNAKETRQIGEMASNVGDGTTIAGYGVSLIPHPVTQVVGKGLIITGDLLSAFGTSMQVAADISESKDGDAAIRVATELTGGFFTKKVDKLVDADKLDDIGGAILNISTKGKENVIDEILERKNESKSSNSKVEKPVKVTGQPKIGILPKSEQKKP